MKKIIALATVNVMLILMFAASWLTAPPSPAQAGADETVAWVMDRWYQTAEALAPHLETAWAIAKEAATLEAECRDTGATVRADMYAIQSRTPTATPTRGVDLVTERVFQSGEVIHAEVCNIGDEDAICPPAEDLVDVNITDCTNDVMLTGEMIYDTSLAAGACELVTFDESDLILAAHHDNPYAEVRGSVNDGSGYGGYYVDELNRDNNASACVNIYVPTPTPTLTPTPMETPTPAPRFRCEITTTIDYSASHVALVYYTIEHRQPTGALYYAPVRLRLDGRLVHEQTFAFTAHNTHTYKSSWGIALADYQLINEHEFALDVDDGAATCAVLIGEPAAIDDYYRGADGKLWRYRREVSLGIDKLGDALHYLLTPAILALFAGGAILIIWRRRT